MKKIMIAAILVLAFALTASAQVPVKPFSIYIGGGLTLPNSPDGFKDMYKTGFHGLAALAINLPTVQGLSVLGKLQYHMLSLKDDVTFAGEAITDGGSAKIFMFGADGVYRLGTPGGVASPFFGAGGGFANSTTSDITTASGTYAFDSSTDFYWNILAGLDLKAGPSVSLFATFAYVSISTEGDAITMIPITVGLKF